MRLHRLILAPLLAALAACDTPAAPTDLLVASETRAAIALADALPTLDRMAVRRVPPGDRAIGDIAVHAAPPVSPDDTTEAGRAVAAIWADFSDDPETRLALASAMWLDADSLPADQAAGVRERAYALAAPVLAAGIDPAFLDEAFGDLAAWIDAARPAVDLGAVPDLKATLQEGAEGLELARGAAASGDTVMAVRATLRAADALRETTPPVVAVRLIRLTTAKLNRATTDRIDPNPDPRDRRAVALARARRLLAGAREAMGDDDPVLAIRHAYYADRLLEGFVE
jgi:hypothetical protein